MRLPPARKTSAAKTESECFERMPAQYVAGGVTRLSGTNLPAKGTISGRGSNETTRHACDHFLPEPWSRGEPLYRHSCDSHVFYRNCLRSGPALSVGDDSGGYNRAIR